jgi:tripartite ATP-independent transporter DctM subunit
MFGSLLVLLATGLPIAFGMGAVGLIFTLFVISPQSIAIVASTTVGLLNAFVLLAIPLFIFMAAMLERSGVVEDLFSMMHSWFGALRGGLAVGTVVMCTIFAAMSGVSAAGTVAMGVIALPAMLKRKYNKDIAIGCISAGGALGQLIPPSAMMIIYSLLANESVGRMFLGGIFPGLILSGLFIIYILIRCYIQPDLGPSLPPEERASWGEKLISLRAVILPILLIVAVLGSIFGGITSPTEAAGVGAFGSIVCAAIYRRLTWTAFKSALYSTLRFSCMILWLMIAGSLFASVYTLIGGQNFVTQLITGLEINPWIVIFIMQLIWIFLGMLMDPNGILFITIPVFLPIITSLGFSPLWFGVLWVVNMELGFLTPPFGMNLFYMKAIVPEGITMVDIYRSIVPFVLLQFTGLVICMVFPQTIEFLPNLIMGLIR